MSRERILFKILKVAKKLPKKKLMEREAVRINVSVPISIRKITPQEMENKVARIVGEIPYLSYIPLHDTMDEALNNWLKLINAKLDFLINLLTREKEGFSDLPFQSINLSEKGLSLKIKEKLNPDDLVEIKVVLDLFGPLGLYLYGKVVWVEALSQDTYKVGIAFINLPLDIKEKIGLYILNKEREFIREKRTS